MANSNWLEADRVDRLKPIAQLAYNWCLTEMDLQLEPPERYFRGREVEWCTASNKVRVIVTTFNSRYPYSFEADSLEGIMEQLETRGCAVPESLMVAVHQERRLRVSEEELDYRLGSGDPY